LQRLAPFDDLHAAHGFLPMVVMGQHIAACATAKSRLASLEMLAAVAAHDRKLE